GTLAADQPASSGEHRPRARQAARGVERTPRSTGELTIRLRAPGGAVAGLATQGPEVTSFSWLDRSVAAGAARQSATTHGRCDAVGLAVDHRLVLAGGQRRVEAGRAGGGRLIDCLLPRGAELRCALGDRVTVLRGVSRQDQGLPRLLPAGGVLPGG